MSSLLFPTRALAAFHLWDFSEVYSNADGTIQFIEFTTFSSSETQVAGRSLTSNSTTGYTLPCCNLVGSTSNRKFLVATSAFAALSGAVTPDFVMPDNFIAVTGGDTLTLVGADFFTFGSGLLPVDGVLSLNKNLTTGTNSPTNFAGQTGEVNVPPLDTNDVFVDFGAGSGGFGTQVLPFDTLQDALDIVAGPSPQISLEPGSTTETFSAGSSISTALTLINLGDDPVTIGAAPEALTNDRSGFITRR